MSFFKDESGQGMTEYILLVFLIAILAYVAVQMFGGKIKSAFTDAGNEIGKATK